jgi:hypothetical protein
MLVDHDHQRREIEIVSAKVAAIRAIATLVGFDLAV